ncbi:MAG: response regulator [Caldisericaceae bacterium]|nr:response regulator [Caldisericaceae bacterium]
MLYKFSRLVTLAIILIAHGLFSASVRIPHYPSIRYTVDDGLPQSIVSALMQDSYGFLWIATNEGIAKFNGHSFEVFNEGSGYPFRLVTGIVEKNPGIFWISTIDKGIWQLSNKQAIKIKIDSTLQSDHINFLIKTFDNEILIGAEPGGLYVIKHDSLKLHIKDSEGGCAGPIISAAKDYEGNYWIGTYKSGIQVFNRDKEILHLTLKYGLPSNEIRAILPRQNGEVWIGTRYGLYVHGNPSLSQKLKDLIPNSFVSFIYSRNDRDIWVNLASSPGGVWHFKDNQLIEILRANESFYSRTSLIDESGTLFLGSYQGLIVYPNRNFENFGKESGLTDTYIRAITKGPDDSLWVATKIDGLFKLVGSRFVKVNLPDSLFAGNSIFSLKTFDQTLWLGTARGLYIFDGKKLIRNKLTRFFKNLTIRRFKEIGDTLFIVTKSKVLAYKNGEIIDYSFNLNSKGRISIWGIARDKFNRLLIGTNGQGAFLLKNKQWQTLNLPDSLRQIFSVRAEKNNILYLATSNGLYQWNGQEFSTALNFNQTVWDVLPMKSITWLLTSNGLYQLKRNRVRIYNLKKGLITTEFNMGAVFRVNENEAWFGGVEGLVRYKKILTYPDFLPKFLLTQISSKDSLITFPFPDQIILPFSNNSLRFHFKKINFGNAPYVRFAYWLQGFNQDTVYLHDENINFVDYSYLPDGKYTFHLFLINPFTNEIAAQRSVSFIVLPPWYKSPIFIFLFILLLAALVFVIVHARESYLRKKNQLLEMQVQERTEDIRQSYRLLKQETEQRKKAQLSLKKEREQLEITLKSIADGVIRTDLGGKILLMNNSAEKMFNLPIKKAINRSLAEVITLKDEGSNEIIKLPDHVKQWENQGDAPSHFYAIFEPPGPLPAKHLNISWAKIESENKPDSGYVWVFRDVSIERQLEEEILKSQKLESIGLLAGGIAHDFNNILAGILGNAQLAKLNLGKDDLVKKYLDGIEEASLNASQLTKQLLTFAKGGEPVKEIISLTDILTEGVEFALRGSNVSANFEIDSDLWPVEADKGQINQVINNLVINAIQAMPGGGTLTIKAKNCTKEEIIQPELEGDYFIKIQVSDTGHGISEKDLAKIFDPYFTTKQRGSGLGLATSYAIIKKHGGIITVDSRLGEGTSFTIYLPARPEAEVNEEHKEAKIHSFKGKRVLVMDDEEYIRELMGSFLEMLEIEADFANDGQEAIEKYKLSLEQKRPFDAIIMDLTVRGGMGGREATAEILKLNPQAKVIVSSGYSTDGTLANYQEQGFIARLNKPFTLEELNNILIEVLSSKNL